MTDKICEIETVAIAHRACSADDSGILLTDFACAHSSVDHKTRVLQEKTLRGKCCPWCPREGDVQEKMCQAPGTARDRHANWLGKKQRKMQCEWTSLFGKLKYTKGLFRTMEEVSEFQRRFV